MTNNDFIAAVEAIEQLKAQRDADVEAAKRFDDIKAAQTHIYITADQRKEMLGAVKAALNEEVAAIVDEYRAFVERVAPMIHAYEADVVRGNKAVHHLALLAGDPDVILRNRTIFAYDENTKLEKMPRYDTITKTGSNAYRTVRHIISSWENHTDGVNK